MDQEVSRTTYGLCCNTSRGLSARIQTNFSLVCCCPKCSSRRIRKSISERCATLLPQELLLWERLTPNQDIFLLHEAVKFYPVWMKVIYVQNLLIYDDWYIFRSAKRTFKGHSWQRQPAPFCFRNPYLPSLLQFCCISNDLHETLASPSYKPSRTLNCICYNAYSCNHHFFQLELHILCKDESLQEATKCFQFQSFPSLSTQKTSHT